MSESPGEKEALDQLPAIVGKSWSRDNRITVLENGDEIFSSMLEAINRAESSIRFLTYVYWEGDIAKQFADALSARAKEGLEVRVLLDAHGSIKTSRKLLQGMKENGVTLAKYNPFDIRHPLRYQHRTHRKILVCDEEIGFIGGVGIADEWDGDARNPGEWHDFHFRIEGPIVKDAIVAFEDNWSSRWTKLGDNTRPETVSDLPAAPSDRHPLPELHSGAITDADILPLISSPKKGSSIARDIFRALLQSAQKKVRITSAYLIPDDFIIKSLCETAARGVEIEIIVPGKHRDSWLAQSRSRLTWGELMECGIRFYQYNPTMCHAKIVVIDEEIATVGSINFDLLSFRLNEEANLLVRNRDFCRVLIDKFEHDKRCSTETTHEEFSRRSRWMKLKEWLAYHFPLPYWTEDSDW